MRRCVTSCNSLPESACMPAICRVTRLRTDVSVCRRQRRSHFSKQCPSEPQSMFSERRREAGSTRLIIRLTRRERPQTLTSARAALSGIFSVYSANVPQPFHLIHLHVYLVEVSR